MSTVHHLNLSLTAAVLGQQFVRKNFVDFGLRAKLGLHGLCNKSTRKEVAKRLLPHVVVKFSRIAFCIVCKNEGGGKEVTERRPFSEGKKGKSIHVLFCVNLPLIVAVMMCFCNKFATMYLTCRVAKGSDAMFGDLFFDHIATT